MFELIDAFAGPGFLNNFEPLVNDPSNAFVLEPGCHKSFDRLEWGLEIRNAAANPNVYDIRYVHNPPNIGPAIHVIGNPPIRTASFPAPVPLNNNHPPPNHAYFAVHLALSRVAHASGMADIWKDYDGDDEDFEFVWGEDESTLGKRHLSEEELDAGGNNQFDVLRKELKVQ
jgi:hypothetical protein